MSPELDNIWSQVRAQLSAAVEDSTYRIWLEPLVPVELAPGRLVVGAPRRTSAWVADRFGRLLQASVAAVAGPELTVDLVALDPSRGPHNATAPPGARPPSVPARRAGDQASPSAPTERLPPADFPPNPKLTFDHFVIGDSNRLAHAAALAVAENPSQAYNPLFLCGPPGLGKTHLLHAIAGFLQQHAPSLTVRYTTGEAFTTEFVGALRAGSVEHFKDRFRRVDVLLVDDIQFLERKTRTEEEFFHTFNALSDLGRQLVVTSDRPPRDLEALQDRLRERFEAGLVADLRPPDLPTRLTILRKRVAHDDIPLASSDALQPLAERVRDNVRSLEGALIRVVAFASLTARPFTAALAEEVLDSLYPRSRAAQMRSVSDIQAAACEQFGLSAQELLSKSRAARVAWPRQVAMYAARELTDQSLPAIARQFGGRDHTTVLHACRRTTERITHSDADRLAVHTFLEHLRELG